MKRFIGMLGCMMLVLGVKVMADTTPDDLLKAVDQMTPAQVQSLNDKLQARLWEPIPQGFFTRMAVLGSMSVSSLKDVNLSGVNLSSSDLKLDTVGGGEAELLWWVFTRKCHIGVKFGSWAARDSSLTSAGYSSAALANNSIEMVANYQLVSSSVWQLWTEVGIGGASFAMDTINTPAMQATTLREFDGSYGLVDLGLGVSLRLNSIISLFGASDYTFADSIALKEGDVEGSSKLDASGGQGRLGLSVNF